MRILSRFFICVLATIALSVANYVSAQGFSRISAASANSGEDQFRSAAINSAGTIGYFGTDTGPGSAVKFDLSTMTRSAASVQSAGETSCRAIALDEANNLLYCSWSRRQAQYGNNDSCRCSFCKYW